MSDGRPLATASEPSGRDSSRPEPPRPANEICKPFLKASEPWPTPEEELRRLERRGGDRVWMETYRTGRP